MNALGVGMGMPPTNRAAASGADERPCGGYLTILICSPWEHSFGCISFKRDSEKLNLARLIARLVYKPYCSWKLSLDFRE